MSQAFVKEEDGIRTSYCSWHKAGTDTTDGAQIDLLLDRADDTINICEIKFSSNKFIIDKKYHSVLQNRLAIFRQEVPKKKSIILTFITTYGVGDNAYKTNIIDNEIQMTDLFK